VTAFRKQYNGFKAQVNIVLTGDARVDFLEGPTVGTKDGHNIKFKFNQVKKLSKEAPKAEPEKKEEKKEKNPNCCRLCTTISRRQRMRFLEAGSCCESGPQF
jgi:hypothetical protein